jgi:hypothetical protein
VNGLCSRIPEGLDKMKFCEILLPKILKASNDHLLEDIIGYDHIERLFRTALDSDSAIHILMVGPPATAKTMFLTSLMQLKNSYFADGANSTKAGMIDYLFTNRPRMLMKLIKWPQRIRLCY